VPSYWTDSKSFKSTDRIVAFREQQSFFIPAIAGQQKSGAAVRRQRRFFLFMPLALE
jgi:hypothetical protein